MPADSPVLSPRLDAALLQVADGARYVGRTARATVRPPLYLGEFLRQCHEVGVRTVPLALLTGVITGIVFTQQSRPSLEAFGAASWLPSLVTLALVRSLAPLVTALICAGRVGSSIGAEIGSMQVTEQVDALVVSAVDPTRFLVVTRTMATTAMVPVLTAFFGFVAFIGAFVNVHTNEGTSWAAFVSSAFSSLELLDVGSAVLRAVVFGLTIGLVSCRQGLKATQGTRGVGRAANGAVVQSMLAIFLEEILIVQLITVVRGG